MFWFWSFQWVLLWLTVTYYSVMSLSGCSLVLTFCGDWFNVNWYSVVVPLWFRQYPCSIQPSPTQQRQDCRMYCMHVLLCSSLREDDACKCCQTQVFKGSFCSPQINSDSNATSLTKDKFTQQVNNGIYCAVYRPSFKGQRLTVPANTHTHTHTRASEKQAVSWVFSSSRRKH